MTEEERRRFEQWKRSFGSREALSQAVYRYNADPYWYGGPQEARYIKKGASEEAIEDYYWSVREDEERRERARRELEESNRRYAEREANEAAKKRQRRIIDGSVSDADRSPAPTEWQLSERRRLEKQRKEEEKRREEEKRKRDVEREAAKKKAEDEDLLRRYTYQQYKILRAALNKVENPYGDSIEDRDDDDLTSEMEEALKLEVERRRKGFIDDRRHQEIRSELRKIKVGSKPEYEGDGDSIEDRDEDGYATDDEDVKPLLKQTEESEDYGDPIDDRDEESISTQSYNIRKETPKTAVPQTRSVPTLTEESPKGMSSRLTTAEDYRRWAAEQDKRFEERSPEIAKQKALRERLQSEK